MPEVIVGPSRLPSQGFVGAADAVVLCAGSRVGSALRRRVDGSDSVSDRLTNAPGSNSDGLPIAPDSGFGQQGRVEISKRGRSDRGAKCGRYRSISVTLASLSRPQINSSSRRP